MRNNTLQHNSKKKISLNLGGGGMRAFAHIGVIRCLKEENIPYDMIIGISGGAIVGAIYSLTQDIDTTEKQMEDLIRSKNFLNSIMGNYKKYSHKDQNSIIQKFQKIYSNTNTLSKILLSPSVMTQEEAEGIFFPYIPDISIENLQFPFACVAVNLYKGESRIFFKGHLREAVMASIAMPLIIPPRIIKGDMYLDGAVLDKIGIEASQRMGIHKTIAVDVSNQGHKNSRIRNGLDIMFKIEEIASFNRRKRQLKEASVVLQPIKEYIHWSNYHLYRSIVQFGYEEAKKKIEIIRSKLKLVSPFRRIFLFTGNKKNNRNKT